MIFGDPRWLWALAAVPVLALLELWVGRRADQALNRLVGPKRPSPLLMQLLPGSRRIGATLRLLALTLLILGAARPQWGREVVRRGATGSDVVFLFDVSGSMDARDVPPSRMSEAKREALAVLDRLGGSRVGVVVFAGDAVRLCPLTLDRGAIRLVIESLSSGSVSEPGSDLGKGLRMAMRALPRGRREEQAVVLWTDGEDLGEGARSAVDDLGRAGIRVYAVGVGTPAGDVVPELDGAGRVIDVKRDESGSVVKSALDEGLLRALGRGTRGGYFPAHRPGGDLTRLLNALGSLTRAGKGDRLIERPKARFPLFAFLALVLLVIERGLSRRRRDAATKDTPLHSEERAAAAAMLLIALAMPGVAEAQSAWAKGDRSFKAGRFAEAESLYAQRLKKGGPAEVRVNRATAQALRGGTSEARAELEKLAERRDRVGIESGYNLGTALGTQRENEAGLAALRRVLERDPQDQDARWNYEVLQRRIQAEKEPAPEPEPPKPSPSKPEPQKGPGQSPQNPGAGNPPPSPSPQNGPPPPGAGAGSRMNRSEAEQILDALQELARSDQQRQNRVKVNRERRGKDW